MNIKSIKAMVNRAAERDNQTEAKSFSGNSLATEGKTVGRFVGYVELGKHPVSYKGKAKDPADKVRLVFELNGPKNTKTVQVDGEDKVITERVYVPLTKSYSDKSGYYKLFMTMRRGREDIVHMAQMLGEAFVITVVHTPSEDGKKTYANISGKGGDWYVEPPYVEDAISGKRTDYPVPPASVELQAFFFDDPQQDAWDSLFIEGETETTDAKGKKVTKSKNFIQETILKAVNFPGSPLEEMLAGGIEIPQESTEETVDEEVDETTTLEDVAEDVVQEEAPLPPPFKKTTTLAKPVAKAPAVVAANKAVKAVASAKAPAKTVATKAPAKAAGKVSAKAAPATNSGEDFLNSLLNA